MCREVLEVWSTWSPEAAVNQSPLAMHEMKRANLGGAIARIAR